MDWKVKKVNDIEENPIECWCAIGDSGTLRRFYKIVPWSRIDVYGKVLEENKYFCLWEGLGIEPDNLCMVAVYENLEDAKTRAKMQLVTINNLIKAYCPKEK